MTESGAEAAFDTLAHGVRTEVERYLHDFFGRKRAELLGLSPRSVELLDEVETLTLRGGKRLRPIVCLAAMRAVDPHAPLSRGAPLGAALELLQTFLLAHDDWMDADLERRGGPSLHAAFRKRHGVHTADCLGILGGDLAQTYAEELLLETPFAHGSLRAALSSYQELCREVYFGQHLDVVGDADIERLSDLKTGSYTVRGPARLGALLGGASEGAQTALLLWANPLGQAFQLADDLLGTFGDPKATGKPGDDLRHGKRNAVVRLAEEQLDANERAPLDAILGCGDANEHAIRAATTMLERAGIRARIEERAATLLAHADSALDHAPFEADGIAVLRVLGRRLVLRTR